MELKIEKYDHQGRGISHYNDKIVFVENAMPDEVVEATTINETSKYIEAKVTEYKKTSPKRTKSKCPFYELCGGCHLRHMSYDDTVAFKKNKLDEILAKYAHVETKIEVIKNKNRDFYRNKIELQVEDGIYGFYTKGSHDIVEVDRCLNVEESINIILRSTHLLHITNGVVTIKSNYNGEIILNIVSSDAKQQIEIENLREKCKLVGIIYNGSIIFGADHFIEIIDSILFKETYNSFFQVNRYINGELFKILNSHIDDNSTVLDLCSGVGTLSIVASRKAKKVYAIEIVENAVKDALLNSKMNKIENVNFLLGDAFKTIEKIDDEIDTVIIDPPRSGLTDEAINSLIKTSPNKIIYISCDPVTLARDLNILKENYSIKSFYLLDMFSYTYHVECVCVLNRR